MRISVDKNDRGYSSHRHEATVLLDGKEVQRCITADEEEGTVLIITSPPGAEFSRGITTELRKGVVKIILPKGAKRGAS